MQHQIKLTDVTNAHMVLLTVSELEASQPAIDVVFDVIGAEDPMKLVSANILPAGQIDELKALQQIVFDRDAEGIFIRDGVTFTANGKDLDPDEPLTKAFTTADRNGEQYKFCTMVLGSPALYAQMQAERAKQVAASPVVSNLGISTSVKASQEPQEPKDPTDEYSVIMFLQQLALGYQIDVTKDFPEISKELATAEKNNWTEIDVNKASYKLTDAGNAELKKYLLAAQDLIKRYDIYCDVDVDGSGVARFDTGLGKDYRIAAYEFEGIDPFMARFLLGINDGEWNNLSNWMELLHDRSWYDRVFEPVETAPSIDDVGRDRMQSIMDQGKAALRQEQNSY